MNNGKKSFRDRFCEARACKTEDFERRLLLSHLYKHAKIPGHLFWVIDRKYFKSDLDLIQILAVTQDLEEFKREIANFRFEHPTTGLLRGTLRLRLSGRNLIRTASGLFP